MAEGRPILIFRVIPCQGRQESAYHCYLAWNLPPALALAANDPGNGNIGTNGGPGLVLALRLDCTNIGDVVTEIDGAASLYLYNSNSYVMDR